MKSKMTGRWLRRSPPFIIGLWVAWIALTLYFGRVGKSADFSVVGQFGDSFGAFSALMGALAAAGALGALSFQLEESARQTFDSNLFSLLSHFTDIVSNTDVQEYMTVVDDQGMSHDKLNREFKGRDALRVMLDELRETLDFANGVTKAQVLSRYNEFYVTWNDDLGHYFRSLYHIFRLIDERCPVDKVFYARIVRA